ncbi:MAG: DUF6517 family protein [Haloarculaceae archaeon]
MRRSLLVVGLVCLSVLAGCSGGGPAPVTVEGTPATVPSAILSDVGYEDAGTTERRVNTTLTVTIQGDIEGRASQPVNATIPVSTYRRQTGSGPAIISVTASPSVAVVENPRTTADPLGEYGPAALLAFAQSAYSEADLEQRGSSDVALLNTTGTMRTYRGTAVRDGERTQVTVHIVEATHRDDVVRVVAVHPATVDERDRIRRLVGRLRH